MTIANADIEVTQCDMKRKLMLWIVPLMVVLMMVGCAGNTTTDDSIQRGDLLFVSLPMDYRLGDSAYVPQSKEKNYIHVAIIDVDDSGETWIIDATIKHGVDRYSVDSFLCDFMLRSGKLPEMDVMRLEDNSRVDEYVENAMKYIGEKYDTEFTIDNGAHYCSELVYDSYTDGEEHLFQLVPLDFGFDHGEVPGYWTAIFSRIGSDIPQGRTGIWPSDMIKSTCLKPVNAKIIDVAKEKPHRR